MKRPTISPIDNPLAREFLLEGDRRGILLIHGFTATPSQMRPLGEALHREGYTVLGVLLPGHGTTVEDMERQNWSVWLKACRDSFNTLAKRCNEISVAGLSMGGILALILASELPVKAAVSIAAPLRLQNILAKYSWLLGVFVRYQGWPEDPEKDTKERENAYHIGYPVTPVRKVPDLLRLAHMAERGLPAIRCPLLVVQPRKDDTVRLDSPDLILKGAVNSPYRKMLWLENSRHVCTVEPEFDLLFGEISEFLRDS